MPNPAPTTATTAVIIFAKPPIAGESKTRLAKHLGHDRAAKLAAAFLRDTVATARRLQNVRVILAITSPWSRYEAVDPALGAELGDLPRWSQGEGDLGARMERALRRGLAEADRAVILGADSPALPLGHLQAALRSLDEADSVFGPALDGGYYLIGLRRCPEGCLANLPWSQSHTLQASIAQLFHHGFRPTVAPSFFDIDTHADLHTFTHGLTAGLWRAPHTEAALLAFGATLGAVESTEVADA